MNSSDDMARLQYELGDGDVNVRFPIAWQG